MIQIHPTVIMTISEHHTRTRAIKLHPEVVIGALLGKKSDQNIEIVDSFELNYTISTHDGAQEVVLDTEFYHKKLPLVKQVFGDLELVGWYATTPIVTVDGNSSSILYDDALNRQVSELIPNPVYLKLNPYQREGDPKISGSLPLQVLQPVVLMDSGVRLMDIAWTVVTEEVEIIGLEHSAKMTDQETTPSLASAAIDNLRLQYSAVKQLKDRIKVISKFVKDVQSGNLPYHEETLAEISKLSHRFPLMNSEAYIRAYNIQCNDVALNTYLGVLTKGSMSSINFANPPSSKVRAMVLAHARR